MNSSKRIIFAISVSVDTLEKTFV